MGALINELVYIQYNQSPILFELQLKFSFKNHNFTIRIDRETFSVLLFPLLMRCAILKIGSDKLKNLFQKDPFWKSESRGPIQVKIYCTEGISLRLWVIMVGIFWFKSFGRHGLLLIQTSPLISWIGGIAAHWLIVDGGPWRKRSFEVIILIFIGIIQLRIIFRLNHDSFPLIFHRNSTANQRSPLQLICIISCYSRRMCLFQRFQMNGFRKYWQGRLSMLQYFGLMLWIDKWLIWSHLVICIVLVLLACVVVVGQEEVRFGLQVDSVIFWLRVGRLYLLFVAQRFLDHLRGMMIFIDGLLYNFEGIWLKRNKALFRLDYRFKFVSWRFLFS